MKKLWFRVGMEAEVTDEFFEHLVSSKNGEEKDALFVEMISNATLSGETYIVGKENGGVEEYDNPDTEISTLF